MFARCGKILVVAALVLTTGLHWATLQTVAWTTMLADNLCNQSFTTAVSRTFDGQHLCPLCRAIAAGKKSEKKSEALAIKLKLEFPPSAQNFIFISPKPASALSLATLVAKASSLQPPSPPPRSFFV